MKDTKPENSIWERLDTAIVECCPETQQMNLSVHRGTCLVSLGARHLRANQKCSLCGHKRKETYAMRTNMAQLSKEDVEFKIVCFFCGWLWWTDRERQMPFTPLNKKLEMATAVFCDGGLIGMNRYGGTWAWCGTDSQGDRVVTMGGFAPGPPTVLEDGKRPSVVVTNNHTEQIAIIKALESMPNGWNGTVYSDSSIALQRVFEGAARNNLTKGIIARTEAAVDRMGKGIQWRLLQGHPTEEDLRNGIGAKRQRPVAIHNVWCDWECERQRAEYFKIYDVEGVFRRNEKSSIESLQEKSSVI